MTKKDIYAAHGIEFKDGKILSPLGWIAPLLKDGNTKLGDGIGTFSTLPGTGEYTVTINGNVEKVTGTCKCDCVGCYAKVGRYNFPDVVRSMAINTIIARDFPDFMVRAISAQIQADHIIMVRIHAAGDFKDIEYIIAWKKIVSENPNCVFWTYTKNPIAESAFDSYNNCNVVKSIIPGCGFNFGHCDYILNTYNLLKSEGKRVHICKCGFDKSQHCNTCKGCSENEYVLFVEHSTAYKATKDPRYNELYKIAMGGVNND